MAPDHLIKIKNRIPPLNSNVLERTEILNQLRDNFSEGEGYPQCLTLISAAAGSGKTTLVRSWLKNREQHCAWFSIDEGDHEPERFWTYLIAALQMVNPALGRGSLEILRSLGPSPENLGGELLLTPLLNDLLEMQTPLILVLDDYHLVTNTGIHKDMVFLLENLPPSLHVAVTTRSDPPWPLSRWRSREMIREIRLKELKFTEEEAKVLLDSFQGLYLTEEQFHALYEKTEGWVTGLKLAASTLSASDDADAFIKSFTGSHKQILHFLSDEVLGKQPEEVREFLYHTAIFDRFCPALCDAVTGRKDSGEILSALERDNLFVIPLDDQGIWYRYHHLFGDLLAHQLKRRFPGKDRDLNEKAGEWFYSAGEPARAVDCYLKARNPEKVADILRERLEDILDTEGTGMVISSLEGIPRDLLMKDPELVVQKAWFHLVHQGRGGAEEVLALIRETEAYGNEIQAKNGNDAPAAKTDSVRGMAAVVKAYALLYTGNFPEALKNTEMALRILPRDSNYWRSKAGIISGDARLFTGNPKGAYPYYLDAHMNNEIYGNSYLILTSGFKVATCLYFRGKLQEAEVLARKLLKEARDRGIGGVPRTGLVWTLLGEYLRERGSLAEGEQCMERGIHLSGPEKPSQGWNILFRASLAFSKEDYDQVLENISFVEALDGKYGMPDFITFPTAVKKARVLLETGDLARCEKILADAGVHRDRKVMPGRERGFLTLVRLMLRGETERASAVAARNLLEQIQESAVKGEYLGLIVETLLVKAALEEKEGSREQAEDFLLQALQKAVSAGYYQTLLDEGRGLGPVLQRVRVRLSSGNRDKQSSEDNPLLALVTELSEGMTVETHPTGGVLPYQELVEALSPRELEILNLLSRGSSNREIGEKLYLTLGTVKWYTSNIYGKLGVRNRTEAVVMAQKLKLIS